MEKQKRKFIVIKETPELPVGAIMTEKCTDGTQNFECLEKDTYLFDDQNKITYSRKTVIEGKTWFKEITPEKWNSVMKEVIKKLIK